MPLRTDAETVFLRRAELMRRTGSPSICTTDAIRPPERRSVSWRINLGQVSSSFILSQQIGSRARTAGLVDNVHRALRVWKTLNTVSHSSPSSKHLERHRSDHANQSETIDYSAWIETSANWFRVSRLGTHRNY